MIVVVVAVVVFKLVVAIVFIVVDIAKVTLPTSYQTVIVSLHSRFLVLVIILASCKPSNLSTSQFDVEDIM